ncbi:MAG: 7-carboxy-7-deazaguanine synthase QueE [Flavobacteriales bacterium]|nr:7-carboxy-7-deazaguanine synthase QueE [Flavobacteriales bacterium]
MKLASTSFLEFSYPVMEHFYTIQGEGAHAGKAAYFIRIGGCNVGCPWCDVKESWEAEDHPNTSVAQILEWLQDSDATNVVITGGEPTMYDLNPICTVLKKAGYQLWLETSGAYPISGMWDWIVLSPKRRKMPLDENYPLADELKQVIVRLPDFDLALAESEKMNEHARLFMQPEWSREEEVLPAIINFVKKNPRWQISLQTHKYMQIP